MSKKRKKKVVYVPGGPEISKTWTEEDAERWRAERRPPFAVNMDVEDCYDDRFAVNKD